MPAWFAIIIEWLCVLGGVVLTWSLCLYFQFRESASGYMWRAASRLRLLLLTVFLIESLIAALLFQLAASFTHTTSVLRLLTAALAGVIMAGLHVFAESLLLPKHTNVASLERPLTRLLFELNLDLRHKFARAMALCVERDLYDCQRGWGLGISHVQLRRRIRLLYEVEKIIIARKRGDLSFLRYDVGKSPWEKFYLLVRHLGRARLRKYLADPPATFTNWEGEERRRRVGAKSDRLPEADAAPHQARVYDDVAFMRALLNGEVEVRYTEPPPAGTGLRPDAGPEQPDEEELVGENADETFSRALAATWPVGPVVLHILLSEGPMDTDKMAALLRNDDVPNIVNRLVEARLVEPKLVALFMDEDEGPLFRLALTKTGARVIVGLKEKFNDLGVGR